MNPFDIQNLKPEDVEQFNEYGRLLSELELGTAKFLPGDCVVYRKKESVYLESSCISKDQADFANIIMKENKVFDEYNNYLSTGHLINMIVSVMEEKRVLLKDHPIFSTKDFKEVKEKDLKNHYINVNTVLFKLMPAFVFDNKEGLTLQLILMKFYYELQIYLKEITNVQSKESVRSKSELSSVSIQGGDGRTS